MRFSADALLLFVGFSLPPLHGLENLLLEAGALGLGPLVGSRGFLAGFVFFLRFFAKLLFSLVIARPRWGAPLVELPSGA